MLGIGMPELIVIAVIALIVIGPDKLPGLAKTLGRIFGELKKATNEFKDTMEVESKMTEVKKAFDGISEKEIADKAETADKSDTAEKDDAAEKLENLEDLSEPPDENTDDKCDDKRDEKNNMEKEVQKKVS